MVSKLDGGFAVVQSGGLFYVIIPSSGVIAIRKGFKTLADARDAYGEKRAFLRKWATHNGGIERGKRELSLFRHKSPWAELSWVGGTARD